MQNCIVGSETARMLELGHPWVLADRYTKKWPQGQSGDLIALVDENHRFLATALLDPGDRIVARVLEQKKLKLNLHWITERLQRAIDLRRHALLEQTDCYRLVNAEGDELPGLTLDRYGDYLMLQLYTSSWEPYLPLLTQAIDQCLQPRGLYRKFRPQETRALEAKARNKDYSRLIAGEAAPTPLLIEENGLSYLVDLKAGLNTGLFPDQRRNRREIMARAQGKRVLNLFAFTGAFSVAAASAGASAVTSVDVSDKYLNTARENFTLNQLDIDQHEFVVADVFSTLAKMREQKRRFDMIIFDPPSFSTTKKSRFSTQGGTAKLAAATLPLLDQGGLLVSSSNHQKVGLDDYLKELRKGALQVGSDLKTIFVSGQCEDFPAPVTFPQGRYLKFVINVKS